MGRKFAMRKFNPAVVNKSTGENKMLGYFIVINGRRGSGKPTVALDIMYHLQKDIDIVVAVSETADVTGALDGVIPSSML